MYWGCCTIQHLSVNFAISGFEICNWTIHPSNHSPYTYITKAVFSNIFALLVFCPAVLKIQALKLLIRAWASVEIVLQFQKNVPQCKIGKTVHPQLSTVHNTIKRFGESREIPVHKGQGRQSMIGAGYLLALRRPCIKIGLALYWKYTEICHAMHKCKLKLLWTLVLVWICVPF